VHWAPPSGHQRQAHPKARQLGTQHLASNMQLMEQVDQQRRREARSRPGTRRSSLAAGHRLLEEHC